MALSKHENQSERDEMHISRGAETVKYYELKLLFRDEDAHRLTLCTSSTPRLGFSFSWIIC